MANIIEGNITAKGLRFAIVASRFNEFITSKLLEGALDMLRRHGAAENAVDVVWVPGAFEIPLAAKNLRPVGNMTLSFASARSFVAQLRIMITYAARFPRALRRRLSRRAFR